MSACFGVQSSVTPTWGQKLQQVLWVSWLWRVLNGGQVGSNTHCSHFSLIHSTGHMETKCPITLMHKNTVECIISSAWYFNLFIFRLNLNWICHYLLQFWLSRRANFMCASPLSVLSNTYIMSWTQTVTGAPKGASLSTGPVAAFKMRVCVCLLMLPCKDSYLCHWNSFKKACIQTVCPLIPSCWEIINIFSLSPAHYGQHTLITGWIYRALRPHSPCFGRASAGTA